MSLRFLTDSGELLDEIPPKPTRIRLRGKPVPENEDRTFSSWLAQHRNANPMTVPHATVERTNHATGEVEPMPIGSLVNVKGAQFTVNGPRLTVHLDGGYSWAFACANETEAKRMLELFSTRGQW